MSRWYKRHKKNKNKISFTYFCLLHNLKYNTTDEKAYKSFKEIDDDYNEEYLFWKRLFLKEWKWYKDYKIKSSKIRKFLQRFKFKDLNKIPSSIKKRYEDQPWKLLWKEAPLYFPANTRKIYSFFFSYKQFYTSSNIKFVPPSIVYEKWFPNFDIYHDQSTLELWNAIDGYYFDKWQKELNWRHERAVKTFTYYKRFNMIFRYGFYPHWPGDLNTYRRPFGKYILDPEIRNLLAFENVISKYRAPKFKWAQKIKRFQEKKVNFWYRIVDAFNVVLHSFIWIPLILMYDAFYRTGKRAAWDGLGALGIYIKCWKTIWVVNEYHRKFWFKRFCVRFGFQTFFFYIPAISFGWLWSNSLFETLVVERKLHKRLVIDVMSDNADLIPMNSSTWINMIRDYCFDMFSLSIYLSIVLFIITLFTIISPVIWTWYVYNQTSLYILATGIYPLYMAHQSVEFWAHIDYYSVFSPLLLYAITFWMTAQFVEKSGIKERFNNDFRLAWNMEMSAGTYKGRNPYGTKATLKRWHKDLHLTESEKMGHSKTDTSRKLSLFDMVDWRITESYVWQLQHHALIKIMGDSVNDPEVTFATQIAHMKDKTKNWKNARWRQRHRHLHYWAEKWIEKNDLKMEPRIFLTEWYHELSNFWDKNDNPTSFTEWEFLAKHNFFNKLVSSNYTQEEADSFMANVKPFWDFFLESVIPSQKNIKFNFTKYSKIRSKVDNHRIGDLSCWLPLIDTSINENRDLFYILWKDCSKFQMSILNLPIDELMEAGLLKPNNLWSAEHLFNDYLARGWDDDLKPNQDKSRGLGTELIYDPNRITKEKARKYHSIRFGARAVTSGEYIRGSWYIPVDENEIKTKFTQERMYTILGKTFKGYSELFERRFPAEHKFGRKFGQTLVIDTPYADFDKMDHEQRGFRLIRNTNQYLHRAHMAKVEYLFDKTMRTRRFSIRPDLLNELFIIKNLQINLRATKIILEKLSGDLFGSDHPEWEGIYDHLIRKHVYERANKFVLGDLGNDHWVLSDKNYYDAIKAEFEVLLTAFHKEVMESYHEEFEYLNKEWNDWAKTDKRWNELMTEYNLSFKLHIDKAKIKLLKDYCSNIKQEGSVCTTTLINLIQTLDRDIIQYGLEQDKLARIKEHNSKHNIIIARFFDVEISKHLLYNFLTITAFSLEPKPDLLEPDVDPILEFDLPILKTLMEEENKSKELVVEMYDIIFGSKDVKEYDKKRIELKKLLAKNKLMNFISNFNKNKIDEKHSKDFSKKNSECTNELKKDSSQETNKKFDKLKKMLAELLAKKHLLQYLEKNLLKKNNNIKNKKKNDEEDTKNKP